MMVHLQRLAVICTGVAVLSISGCIAVSLGIYESDKRIQTDEKLSGEFIDLYYQERYKFEPMPEYVQFFHTGEEYKKYEFYSFQLDGFTGFGLRLESLGDKVYSELEFEAGEQLYNYENSTLRPWIFGAYEQFDDVFVFYFPRVEGVDQIAEEHGIRFISTTLEEDVTTSLDEDTEKMMLVESSKRLEFIMGELLKSKAVFPMPLIPVAVSDQWPEPPGNCDVNKYYRDLLRTDYPKLVERLEEFDEALYETDD